jgi:hypothetical protein
MVDTISTAASKMVLPLGHGSPNGYCTVFHALSPEIRKTKDVWKQSATIRLAPSLVSELASTTHFGTAQYVFSCQYSVSYPLL